MSEITRTENQATIKPGQDVVASMANDFKAEKDQPKTHDDGHHSPEHSALSDKINKE